MCNSPSHLYLISILPPSLFFLQNPALSVCVRQNTAYSLEYMNTDAKMRYVRQVPMGSLQDMANGLIGGQCDGIIDRQMSLEYLQVVLVAGTCTVVVAVVQWLLYSDVKW